jgi:hypothetical protein
MIPARRPKPAALISTFQQKRTQTQVHPYLLDSELSQNDFRCFSHRCVRGNVNDRLGNRKRDGERNRLSNRNGGDLFDRRSKLALRMLSRQVLDNVPDFVLL